MGIGRIRNGKPFNYHGKASSDSIRKLHGLKSTRCSLSKSTQFRIDFVSPIIVTQKYQKIKSYNCISNMLPKRLLYIVNLLHCFLSVVAFRTSQKFLTRTSVAQQLSKSENFFGEKVVLIQGKRDHMLVLLLVLQH